MSVNYLIILEDCYILVFDVLNVNQRTYRCYTIDDVYLLCRHANVNFNQLHLIEVVTLDDLEDLSNGK